MKAVAARLDIGMAETVRSWVRWVEIDAGERPGTTTNEAEELKRLRRENAELRRANEIMKAAAAIRFVPVACNASRAIPAQLVLSHRSSQATACDRRMRDGRWSAMASTAH
jgi:transposase